jgi:hypothetical protein
MDAMTSSYAAFENLTFEAAIALTQTLLDQMESGALADSDIEQTIANLVNTENGARGFFVTYLSDPRAVGDYPSLAVITALKASPAIVAELLVKNLAMSSAMGVTHRRNQNQQLANGSDRVRSRTATLIQALLTDGLPSLRSKLQALDNSVQTSSGDYEPFLQRWGYDQEQRNVIQDAIRNVLNDVA